MRGERQERRSLRVAATIPHEVSCPSRVCNVWDVHHGAVADSTVLLVPGVRGGFGGLGVASPYVHPFDDGYDYPFGYGEYAEYGPWVSRGYTSCSPMYCMRAGVGRRRVIWVYE